MIPIYGDGKNVRDWLYVTDHCEGIDLVFFGADSGESYHIGGDSGKSHIEVVLRACGILDTSLTERGFEEFPKSL